MFDTLEGASLSLRFCFVRSDDESSILLCGRIFVSSTNCPICTGVLTGGFYLFLISTSVFGQSPSLLSSGLVTVGRILSAPGRVIYEELAGLQRLARLWLFLNQVQISVFFLNRTEFSFCLLGGRILIKLA